MGFRSIALPLLAMLFLESSLIAHGFRVNLIHPAKEAMRRNGVKRSEAIRGLVAKSHARVRWMAARANSSSWSSMAGTTDVESPLHPDGGGYVMDISVGTPGKRFRAIADTGSDLVWVQSEPCTGCSGGTIFDPRQSSTFREMDCSSQLCTELPGSCEPGSSACSYSYEYGSGETEGEFARDTISLGTTSGGSQKFPSFAVGCGMVNSGFDGVDGLVGLGQGPVSLTSQLSAAIDSKFSYCLVDINSQSESSPLLFGPSAALHGTGIQSTKITPPSDTYPTYYLLTVNGIAVAGQTMGSPGTTIIDSGTTLTYVPSGVYGRVLSRMESMVTLPRVDGSSMGLDLCYDRSSNRNYKFPALTIRLAGATMTPPSSNYFLVVDDSGDTVCLAMGSAGGLPVSIIGNVMQQGYHILYDRGSSELSFVQAKCESL
ncbi:aspartic proteinase nepenthesin-2 [Selaginella moellendorffii]|nr:aspartic proteinase nepenthesin-2 [Selaginella moellendorffii]|eukprot:XP_002972637.2 aspartic proteinase nepenthesin-2 [Selaginella moellendorffii]